jgi:hypothetical protein
VKTWQKILAALVAVLGVAGALYATGEIDFNGTGYTGVILNK